MAIPESLVSVHDEEFLAAFERCVLAEERWTHHAHVRVAWICLNMELPDVALARIRKGILQYNTKVLNRRKKYHETVTIASTHIVAERMRDGESRADFEKHIGDLLDPRNPVLLRYYSADRLFSEEARSGFVNADLREIPSRTGARQGGNG
jgi:hypothetical protein